MKILISVPFVGGIGGMQRHILSICKALSDCKIDIYANSISNEGFFPSLKNISVFNPLSFEKHTDRFYDAYIQLRDDGTTNLLDQIKCKKSFLIPCGNNIYAIESKFDYILNQAESGTNYLINKSKHVCLPPPIQRMSIEVEKPQDIPDQYFFTLFNPYTTDRNYPDGYKPIKGYDILYDLAETIKTPIVWGYTSKICKQHPENIKHYDNLIHKVDLTQSEIAYLYENALGYICFSREEGFGWSIGDAILYDLPIFSKKVGILTIPAAIQEGIHLYENTKQLADILNKPFETDISYNKSFMSIENYRSILFDLVKSPIKYKQYFFSTPVDIFRAKNRYFKEKIANKIKFFSNSKAKTGYNKQKTQKME